MKKKKILVVDDIYELRKQVIYALSMFYKDVEYIEAADGTEALSMLIKHKPILVLLDVEMPVMNGLQALKRIRSSLDAEIKKTNVIMFTGVVEGQVVKEIINLGVHDYLVKPFENAALLEKVAKFLEA